MQVDGHGVSWINLNSNPGVSMSTLAGMGMADAKRGVDMWQALAVQLPPGTIACHPLALALQLPSGTMATGHAHKHSASMCILAMQYQALCFTRCTMTGSISMQAAQNICGTPQKRMPSALSYTHGMVRHTICGMWLMVPELFVV